MPVKAHRIFFNFLFGLPILVIGAVACVLLLAPSLIRALSVQSLALGGVALLAIELAAFLFLYLVPAYCSTRGCGGRARPTWEKTSPHESILRYICSRCGQVYDGMFFVTSGGGSWDR